MDYDAHKEIVVHVAAYHPDRSRGYNEMNPGLGLRLPLFNSRWFAAAGFYRNSLDRNTTYVGVGVNVPLSNHVGLRFTTGMMTGYEVPFLPVVIPEMVISGKNYGVAIGFVPKIVYRNYTNDAAFMFSLTKRF